MISRDFLKPSFYDATAAMGSGRSIFKKLLLAAGLVLGILLFFQLYPIAVESFTDTGLVIILLQVAALLLTIAIGFVCYRDARKTAGADITKTIVEIIPDLPAPVFSIGPDGKIHSISQHLCRLMHVSEDDLIGLNIADQMHGAEKHRFSAWLLNPTIDFAGEIAICPKHTAHITVLANPVKRGEDLHYIAGIEFTASAQEEIARYQEFAERFETVIHSAQNVVWDYNFETGESYYNDSIHRLLGYTADEVRGNPQWWSGNIHPNDRERVLMGLEKCIEENYLFWEDEYNFRCASGDYRIIKDYGFIKRYPDGTPHRLFGFMNDVTAEKQLQKQLEEKQLLHQVELAHAICNAQEAERKNISEDLHDNVCQVLGGVKLFVEHCITSKEKNNDLLRQSADHLNNVIDELRKMAHCLSPYFVEEFGLVSGIRELVYFATNFRNTQVNLDIAHFDENILSGSKKLLLYRIVQEQLNNIIKHAQASRITIELRNAGHNCFFLISDNGVGMQLHARKEGLGLKNIRNRVELMNGQVQFISEPGNGFCMQVQFEAA